jgi:hypothetical protein
MITRLLLATLAMFFVGLLGYCGLMLGVGVPYGSGIELIVYVSVCWLLPTCSAREMRSFSALYAVMGLIGGAAYAGPNGKAK